MALPAEMRAFTHKMSSFCGSDWNLGIFVFFYFRIDIQFWDLKAMGDIDTMQHEDDRFTFLESDDIRIIDKSLRDDFNPPGRLGAARPYAAEQ